MKIICNKRNELTLDDEFWRRMADEVIPGMFDKDDYMDGGESVKPEGMCQCLVQNFAYILNEVFGGEGEDVEYDYELSEVEKAFSSYLAGRFC